jgi:hypothetical protein
MSWTTHQEIDRQLTVGELNDSQYQAMARLRVEVQELAHRMLDLTPPCADQSAALRLLRQSLATAEDAIRYGKRPSRSDSQAREGGS